MELLEHEKKHLDHLKTLSSECTLFLKREDFLPINDLKEVALYGNGVRHTVKGGTGSGNVDVHFFHNIEEVFEFNKVKITTKDWLDRYDQLIVEHKKAFIEQVKSDSKAKEACDTVAYSVGRNMPEFEHDLLPLDNSELAIYVLARTSGEGQDRELIKGDYLLTDVEVKTILELNKSHKHFLLVLNVPGPVDLSPVLEVRNILLLSQLGTLTSETLFDIVTGNKYPSGKLSTTWAKYEDYPHSEQFGNLDDTLYKEGIYVGYKHFTTFNKKPLFSFGYGLGYTNFEISYSGINKRRNIIEVKAKVTNKGHFGGKEVIQLYIKKPCQKLDNPTQNLVAFGKTNELKPGATATVTVLFDIGELADFDPHKSEYILQGGIYLLSLGNSSDNIVDVASIEIDKEIVVKKVNSINVNLPFVEDKNPNKVVHKKLKDNIVITEKDVNRTNVEYSKYEVEIPRILTRFSNGQLMRLSCGDIKTGIKSMIGESCSSILGGAGETCLNNPLVNKSLNMVDGPAGIRIIKDYYEIGKKKEKLSIDPIWREILNYLPGIAKPLLMPKKKAPKKAIVKHQYTTAIPTATAIAQSFNNIVASHCGDIIREEMELYGVDIWLAPAMNIHRNVLCGRNFEYFSEDPLLTASMTISLISSIKRNPTKGVVIKHFACNNQEFNRTRNNSILSIRALREIYLKPFELVVKHTHPFGVMASYNLINGEHTSEAYWLLNDILRCEWGFEGVVMTDWIVTGQNYYKKSKYPHASASTNIANGSNLCMPGGKKDIRDMKLALKNGTLTRKQLMNNAAIVLNNINKLKKDNS